MKDWEVPIVKLSTVIFKKVIPLCQGFKAKSEENSGRIDSMKGEIVELKDNQALNNSVKSDNEDLKKRIVILERLKPRMIEEATERYVWGVSTTKEGVEMVTFMESGPAGEVLQTIPLEFVVAILEGKKVDQEILDSITEIKKISPIVEGLYETKGKEIKGLDNLKKTLNIDDEPPDDEKSEKTEEGSKKNPTRAELLGINIDNLPSGLSLAYKTILEFEPISIEDLAKESGIELETCRSKVNDLMERGIVINDKSDSRLFSIARSEAT